MESSENYPSFKKNAKHYFLEFCDRTSIHGFSFIGEHGRSLWEKAWWIIIVTTSIYFSFAMIHQTFYKWKHSPIIVNFANQHTTIWQIPFPAVTICPEIKCAKEHFNYTDYYLKRKGSINLTPDEIAKFEYISLVCGTSIDLLDGNFTTVDVAALDFLYEVQPNFAASVISASWRGKAYHENVSEIFSPIITSQGICHTFNILDRSEFFTDIVFHFNDAFSSNGKKSTWTVENGYTTESDMNSYPRRTMVAGTKGGLSLMLYTSQEDIDKLCGDAFQGFRVAIHPPDQIPRVKQKYFRLPLDHSVVVAIKPNMMTTSKDLKSYDPVVRQCYFHEEKQLQSFEVYNQENCMLECLANFTIQYCGCVSMHSPRQNSTPICGAAIKRCLEKAKATFTINQEDPKTRCDCLPSCSSLDYNTEISYSHWNWRPYMEILQSIKSWKHKDDYILDDKSHLSQLVLYYKDMQFITSERNELYSAADFWSNCGGLLGLFTGATFLSGFEIIYYLTIRLLFNVYIFGYQYWSGSEKLLNTRSNNN